MDAAPGEIAEIARVLAMNSVRSCPGAACGHGDSRDADSNQPIRCSWILLAMFVPIWRSHVVTKFALRSKYWKVVFEPGRLGAHRARARRFFNAPDGFIWFDCKQNCRYCGSSARIVKVWAVTHLMRSTTAQVAVNAFAGALEFRAHRGPRDLR